jgi:hypothetical protein
MGVGNIHCRAACPARCYIAGGLANLLPVWVNGDGVGIVFIDGLVGQGEEWGGGLCKVVAGVVVAIEASATNLAAQQRDGCGQPAVRVGYSN